MKYINIKPLFIFFSILLVVSSCDLKELLGIEEVEYNEELRETVRVEIPEANQSYSFPLKFSLTNQDLLDNVGEMSDWNFNSFEIDLNNVPASATGNLQITINRSLGGSLSLSDVSPESQVWQYDESEVDFDFIAHQIVGDLEGSGFSDLTVYVTAVDAPLEFDLDFKLSSDFTILVEA